MINPTLQDYGDAVALFIDQCELRFPLVCVLIGANDYVLVLRLPSKGAMSEFLCKRPVGQGLD